MTEEVSSESLLTHLQYLNIGLFSTIRFSQNRDDLGILNQSIGEHKIGMLNVKDVVKNNLEQSFDVNWEKVDKMIRYHDVGEIESGEISSVKKTNHDREIEQDALEKILDTFPGELGGEISELLREKEELESIESRIVHAIDKIEPGIIIATERGIQELRDHHARLGTNLIAYETMRYKTIRNLLVEWELDILVDLFDEVWERQIELGLLEEDPQLKLELEEAVEKEENKEDKIEKEKQKEEV